jgi:hypothetical protein
MDTPKLNFWMNNATVTVTAAAPTISCMWNDVTHQRIRLFLQPDARLLQIQRFFWS